MRWTVGWVSEAAIGAGRWRRVMAIGTGSSSTQSIRAGRCRRSSRIVPSIPPPRRRMRRGSGCCRAARWTKDFRLRPFGFEGEGVVFEHGDLSGEARDGYPRIRGVAGRQEPLVVPGRHRPVEGATSSTGGCPSPQRRTRRCRAAARPSLPAKEEQGRCRGDQGAGDGQRRNSEPPTGGRRRPGCPRSGRPRFQSRRLRPVSGLLSRTARRRCETGAPRSARPARAR